MGIHKNVINVGFTVRETHDLRVGTFRRQLAGIAVAFQPAKTFFLFNGRAGSAFAFFVFIFLKRFGGAVEILGADNTQGHAIGRQRQLHMMIKAELFCGTQAAGILWRMSRIIENRRVLGNQNHRLGPHAFRRRLTMRLENFFRRDVPVVQQTIGGLRVAPALDGTIHAGLWILRQGFDHFQRGFAKGVVF